MKKSKKDIYLNFPLQILSDGFEVDKICKLAIIYGIMECMEREGLEGIEGYKRVCKSIDFNVPFPEKSYPATVRLYEETKERIIEKFQRIVWVSIKKSHLLDFMNNSTFYTDLDNDVFRAFIAVKSLLGKKPFINVKTKILVQRMCGIGKSEHLYKNNLTALYDKYLRGTPTPMKHLKTGLKRWKLEIYGGDQLTKMRGFYVSFIWNEEHLINHVKEMLKAKKDKKINDELNRKQIIENANSRLHQKEKPITTTDKLKQDIPF